MKKEILNLANDLSLKGDKRKAFINEMKSLTTLMRKNDWKQFYNISDTIMQKYGL
jgi:hypothetical protein